MVEDLAHAGAGLDQAVDGLVERHGAGLDQCQPSGGAVQEGEPRIGPRSGGVVWFREEVAIGCKADRVCQCGR
jgi:hypothetical protein